MNIGATASDDDDFAAALLGLDDPGDGRIDPLQRNRR